MIGGNKIEIPWYKRNIKPLQYEEAETQPLATHNFDFSKPKGRSPVRQPQTVKQPQTVTNPATNPVTNPVLEPNPFPSPLGDFNENPFKTPFPIPLPLPAPKNNVPSLPSPNLKPQPTYSQDEQNWADNFAKNLNMVATITGVASKSIYDFVSSYDFEKKGLGNFRTDAIDKFGMVAATLLTIGIVGKEVVSLWGRRAATMFSPPIILDDDFFNKYFGSNNMDT